MADDEAHVKDLYDAITKGRVSEKKGTWENGLDYISRMMPNGVKIQWRSSSSGQGSYGPTIEIYKQGGRGVDWKIHMFPPK